MITGAMLLSHMVVLAVVQLDMEGIIPEVGVVEKWTGGMVGMVSMVHMAVMGEAMVEVLQVSMVAIVDMDMDLGMVGPCMEMLDMLLPVMAFLVVMLVLLDIVVVEDMEELMAVVVMTMARDMKGLVVLCLEDTILTESEIKWKISFLQKVSENLLTSYSGSTSDNDWRFLGLSPQKQLETNRFLLGRQKWIYFSKVEACLLL